MGGDFLSGKENVSSGVGRRGVLKFAVTAIVAGVVAGVGGYFSGVAAAPPAKTVTETMTETLAAETITVTAPAKTVTETMTITLTPTVAWWEKYMPRADRLLPEWVLKMGGYPKGYLAKYDWARALPWDDIIREMEGKTCNMIVEGVDVGPIEMYEPLFKELTKSKTVLTAIPTAVYHEKLMAEMTSPVSKIDVADLFFEWTGAYLPYLIDISPFIEKYNIDLGSIHPLWRRLMLRGERVIGLVKDADSKLFYSRLNLLEKAGWSKPPTTWEEVIAACEDLKPIGDKEGWYPIVVQYPAKGWFCHFMFLTMAFQWEDFTCVELGTWKPKYATEGAVKALETVKTLLEYAPPGNIDFGYEEYRTMWLAGKAAMTAGFQCFGQAWDPKLSKISPVTTDNIIICSPFPKGTTLRIPGNWATTVMGIPKAARSPELAFLWSVFIGSQESSMIMGVARTGTECGHTEMLKNPVVQKMMPPYKVIWETAHTAWTEPWAFIPEVFEIETAVGTELYKYISGAVEDPWKVLKSADEKATEILEKRGYFKPGAPEPPILSLEEWCRVNKVSLPRP